MRDLFALFAAAIALTVGVESWAQGGQPTSRVLTSTTVGTGSTGAAPKTIEVFANSATYIAHADRATVYRVDGRQQIASQLDQGNLPVNPEQAAAMVRQRMKAMGPDLESSIQTAVKALERSAVYGIEKVPAMVFDGRRVVYGVTDVVQALAIVRQGGGQPIAARFESASEPPAPQMRLPASTPRAKP